MFGKKKKMYKIVYQLYTTYTTLIEAKDEFQALRKFKRELKYSVIRPTIISFEEVSIQ